MKIPAAIRKVPPLVWVIAGGAVLALYFMSRGQGAATGGLPTGGVSPDSGGGGGGGTDQQGYVTADQLQSFISQEQDAQQSFIQDVLGLITDPSFKGPKGDPGTPGAPGKPGLPGKPGAPGTVTRPVTPIESVLRKLVISGHSTPVYDKPGGKVIGHIGTGSYYVRPRVKIGGAWYYQIVRTVSGAKTTYATHYIPAEPWEKITTPATPAKVA